MSCGRCAAGLGMIALCGTSAFAQFQTATVTVLAEARSHLDTAYGVGDLSEGGGAGAYPLFQGSANADQISGPSGVIARSQLGLELSEMGVSANGSIFLGISADEGFHSASVSALSSVWIDFVLGSARTWRIDPGTTTGPSGNAQVTLYAGDTEVFVYSGEFGGATGELAAGAYRLAIRASASIESTGTSSETGGTYTLGFTLGSTDPCPADLNGDHVVDDFDFLLFLPAYDVLDCADPAMPEGCPADLNGDGVVDDADFLIFLPAYDTLVCPTNS
ncbi:MAG: hypothetical protein JNK16_14600 [Phycisphaerales bacterium]|nr:hypothetical protein [Phycisphaerales bacterium]